MEHSEQSFSSHESRESKEMTAIPKEFIELAQLFKKETMDDTMYGLGKWMGSYFTLVETESNEKFRKRTVEQIFKEKDLTGCSDAALVLISMLRAGGTPALWVETFDKDWLSGKIQKKMPNGHVYAKALLHGQQAIIDPVRVFVRKGEAWRGDIERDKRVVFAEGLDSRALGIVDANSMMQKAEAFRAVWQSQNKKEE